MIGLRQYSFSGIVSASARAGGRAAANIRRPLYAEEEEQPRQLVQGGSRQAGRLDRLWLRPGAPVDPCTYPAEGRPRRRCSPPSLLARHQDRRCSGDKPLDGRTGARAFRSAGVCRRAHLQGVGPAHSQKSAIKPWLKGQWSIPPKQDASFVWRMEDVLEV